MKLGAAVIIVLAILSIGLLSLPLWLPSGMSDAQSNSSTLAPTVWTVSKGSIRASFNEQGVIQARRSERYALDLGRHISDVKIVWLVDEGVLVNVGDKIAEFDASSIIKDIETQNDAVKKSEEEKAKLDTDIKLWELESEKKVIELESARLLAQRELDNLKEGEGKLRVARAAAEIGRATAARSTAIAKLKDVESLHADGFATDDELKVQLLAVEESEQALALRLAERDSLETYQLPLDIAKASASFDARVREARSYDSSRSAEATLWKRKQERLDEVLKDLNKRITELQTAQTKCVIVSRVSGFVIRSEGWFGGSQRKVQIGDSPWEGQDFLEQPDFSGWTVQTKIREIDLPRIRDRKPRITIHPVAFPDLSLSGSMATVGIMSGAPQSGKTTSNVFPLMIEITDKPDGAKGAHLQQLRPGMTARVEIITDAIDNAVIVPVDAVHIDSAGPYVILNGKLPNESLPTDVDDSKRRIVCGVSDGDFIEVREGLTAGEQIIVR